jgi:hypothetical protein
LLFAGLDAQCLKGCAIGRAGDGQTALLLECAHRIPRSVAPNPVWRARFKPARIQESLDRAVVVGRKIDRRPPAGACYSFNRFLNSG